MTINFEATVVEIGSRHVIVLPLHVSEQLPSRGMVMIEGTINGIHFQALLEPDGRGSHWIDVIPSLCKKAEISINDSVKLEIDSLSEWIEPEVPEDIMSALVTTDTLSQWNSVTTKAKWEWIRWIRSTKNPTTRNKRIDVMCSKFKQGDKRPCCFNTSRCSLTDVSKSGVLLE